jgi:hypothetical protein
MGDSVIRRMRTVLITKATDTHSEYVIDLLVAFPRQHRLRERASVSGLYAHFLSYYVFNCE